MSGDSACTGSERCRTGLDPGWRENVIQWSSHHQKWCGGRGTGAVKATGSYEGSSSVEGTSGCHEPSPFTRRWSRRPWRLSHAEERHGSQELVRSLRRQREGAPIFPRSRKRRQRCQRLDRNGRRGNKTPTLESFRVARRERFERQRQRVSSCNPPKRSRVPWSTRSPGKSHRAQDSVGRLRGENRGVSRERTKYGCTQYLSGGRSWSDASRALPSSSSQETVEESAGC